MRVVANADSIETGVSVNGGISTELVFSGVDGSAIFKCRTQAVSGGRHQFPPIDAPYAASHVVSGEARVTYPAAARERGHTDITAAGNFHVDDVGGVPLVITAGPGTLWYCFSQPWAPFGLLTPSVQRTLGPVALRKGSIAAFIDASTDEYGGTFVVRGTADETLNLRSGWAWLFTPQQQEEA